VHRLQMYWLVETSSLIDLLAERFGKGDKGPARLDAACLADLDALE